MMVMENNNLSTKETDLSTKRVGRPKKFSAHENEGTKVVSNRVPISKYLEIKNIVDKIVPQIVNGIYNEKNDQSLDTQILKKLILAFAKHCIKVNLEENEIERIKKLMEELR